MKIGLSYSRCIRDIVEGRVDISDVLVVIARTNFDPHDDDQWSGIWEGYGGGIAGGGGLWTNPEWAGTTVEDEALYRSVSIKLWDQGKFHQPRKFGAHPSRRPEYWLETVLVEGDLEQNPAAKKAWNQFQVVAGLASVNMDKDYQ